MGPTAAQAQKPISLAELAKRNPVDSAPLYAGQKVTISGVVSTSPFHVLDYLLVLASRISCDGDLKSAQHEVGIYGAIWQQCVVRSCTWPEELDHFAKKILKVGFADPRAEK